MKINRLKAKARIADNVRGSSLAPVSGISMSHPKLAHHRARPDVINAIVQVCHGNGISGYAAFHDLLSVGVVNLKRFKVVHLDMESPSFGGRGNGREGGEAVAIAREKKCAYLCGSMQIFILVKQVGKLKALLEPRALQIADLPERPALRLLIEAVVEAEVERFNQKGVGEMPIPHYLRDEQIVLGAAMGKIGFDLRYNTHHQDLGQAIANALVAFQDGLFAVFVDEEEVPSLETTIDLKPGSQVMFLRLALLVGG